MLFMGVVFHGIRAIDQIIPTFRIQFVLIAFQGLNVTAPQKLTVKSGEPPNSGVAGKGSLTSTGSTAGYTPAHRIAHKL